MPEYLLLNVKEVLNPPMLSKAKVKSDRGFYHPITAALLSPVKYPKTPRFVFSFFIIVLPPKISTKNHWRNPCWYASSYSSSPPYLLISGWSCLWSKRHLAQCSSRTYHDTGIRHIYYTYIKLTALLGRKAFISRPVNCSWATWCSPWKTGKCRIMRLDIDDSSYDSLCCHTGILQFVLFINIWHITPNRHALLWVRRVHGPILMGRSAMQIFTGEL